MSEIDAARWATVSVCNCAGKHGGQGLLLDLPTEGVVVLTCHHVITQFTRDDLCVALPQTNGQLGPAIPVQYDEHRSRPSSDAVVLRVEGVKVSERPLLHEMNLPTYNGRLSATGIIYHYNGRLLATNITDLSSATFGAWVEAGISLRVPIEKSEKWPDSPASYDFPFVYKLSEPADARPGISGGVVICAGGVLGLVHFARSAGSEYERQGYLVPISIWADGWPALKNLIEPLIDTQLSGAATIKRARLLKGDLKADSDIVIAGYRSGVYIERRVDLLAKTALEQHDGVVIVGRPKSGKTRLAWRLMQDYPEMLVVIPHTASPPNEFESAGLVGRDLILFVDDLYRMFRTGTPLNWQKSLRKATKGRCLLICTTRDGRDWKKVREDMPQLLDKLGQNAWVFTSRVNEKGEDLSESEGLRLAYALGLNEREFSRRFDGTPGSLTLDLEAMRYRYEYLRDDQRGGVSMSRLLDSAKVLYVANQPRFPISLLRAIAEQIRGEGRLANEVWDTLQRRTQEEGFGQFNSTAGEFQTYQPYLEECVTYQPSIGEIEAILPILVDAKDYSGLTYLSEALCMKYNSPFAEEAARILIESGEKSANSALGFILARQQGREAEAEQAYRNAIDAGVKSVYINLGNLLSEQPGREADAERTYRDAINAGFVAVASHNLGILLDRQPGREADAKQAHQNAIDSGYEEDSFAEQSQYDVNSERIYPKTMRPKGMSEYYYNLENRSFKIYVNVFISIHRS